MIIALILTIACYLIVGLYVYIRVQQLRAEKKKPIQMLSKEEQELEDKELLEWEDDMDSSDYGDAVPEFLKDDYEEDEEEDE